jgi:hypothetical protein
MVQLVFGVCGDAQASWMLRNGADRKWALTLETDATRLRTGSAYRLLCNEHLGSIKAGTVLIS